jgi:hypothetical protein
MWDLIKNRQAERRHCDISERHLAVAMERGGVLRVIVGKHKLRLAPAQLLFYPSHLRGKSDASLLCGRPLYAENLKRLLLAREEGLVAAREAQAAAEAEAARAGAGLERRGDDHPLQAGHREAQGGRCTDNAPSAGSVCSTIWNCSSGNSKPRRPRIRSQNGGRHHSSIIHA